MSRIPTLIVMAGLPGCGKSHAANNFLKMTSIASLPFIYSTDNFIEEKAKAANSTYSNMFEETIREATHWNDDNVKAAFAADNDVIWDQTNLGLKKRRSIISKTPAHYSIICVCIAPPISDADKKTVDDRLKARGAAKHIGGHILASMRNSAVMPTTDEGFLAVHYLDVNGKPISINRAIVAFEESKR
jgi:predicted kinase